MCLILAAWQSHPRYPLVIAANRDEFFRRPAAAATWWKSPGELLAGRDLEAGGTWLGVSRSGRFAALTNFREPSSHRAGTPSRGQLVAGFLGTSDSLANALTGLEDRSDAYNGFNLMLYDGTQFGVYESVGRRGRILPPGVYGLSNHLLDTAWPKVDRAKSRLANALHRLPDDEALLALLRDDRPAADDALPQTGVSLEWERLLSSTFIRANGYGTRCSTIVLFGHDGEVSFSEFSWNERGEADGVVRERFAPAVEHPIMRAEKP